MKKVISKDGTPIAFEQSGEGLPVILVHGALIDRTANAPFAAILARHFTVFNYDRRGRGDSGDTLPYAVEREIEDLEALIDAAGGSAFVHGFSSGGALAMEAAIDLRRKIKKFAMYEAPYNSDEAARQTWKEYRRKLNEAIAAGCRGEAVALFMTLVGMPAGQLHGMQQHPMWKVWEAAAHTLAYDAAIMGEEASVPTGRAACADVPALIINGEASPPFMYTTAGALASAIPNAQHCTLEGQTHEVTPEALAPVLKEFFAG